MATKADLLGKKRCEKKKTGRPHRNRSGYGRNYRVNYRWAAVTSGIVRTLGRDIDPLAVSDL
jgi:hypothetical protein